MSHCLYSNPTFSATLPICFTPTTNIILYLEHDSPPSLRLYNNNNTMRLSKRHFSPLSLCLSVFSSGFRFPGKFQAQRRFLNSSAAGQFFYSTFWFIFLWSLVDWCRNHTKQFINFAVCVWFHVTDFAKWLEKFRSEPLDREGRCA